MIVLTGEPEDVNRSMARFDLHLRCRPHLADMEDFVMAPDVNQLWLEETAPTTLSGVFDAANQFIEEAAQVLLAWWEYSEKWNGALPPPLKAWRPDTALGPSFSGVAPTGQPFQPAAGMVHPSLAKRLAVAERLRQQGTLPGAERSV